MKVRSSLRWIDSGPSFSRKVHAIPYVSTSGKFSLNTLCFWKAHPEQVFTSVISTVYSRLLRISLKRKIRLSRFVRNSLMKVSIVYTITKDNWVIDRFLGIQKNSVKSANHFAHFCVFHLDEDKRFVYSQAFKQAHWLKFQVFRPSDKSSKRVSEGTHLRGLFSDGSFPGMCNGYTYQHCMQFWNVQPILLDNYDTHQMPKGFGLETSFYSSETPYLQTKGCEEEEDW